ncbi:MAG: DUF5680 domain-containing protein [Candidatus Roizmanbacteria bacterium]|nr:DUF5680 domain-containing protein [Candidatus Roizmanbacteria bacterium]
MNLEELRAFLVDANRHTYATGDESLNKKEIDKSTTITYQKEDWSFHDNFFGGEPYGGREVVFYKDQPLWIMVYYGSINNNVAPETVYPTLQKALRAMPPESPFRGPLEVINGEYIYKNSWTGTLTKFSGEEIILKDGKEIYKAHYLGGLVDIKR